MLRTFTTLERWVLRVIGEHHDDHGTYGVVDPDLTLAENERAAARRLVREGLLLSERYRRQSRGRWYVRYRLAPSVAPYFRADRINFLEMRAVAGVELPRVARKAR